MIEQINNVHNNEMYNGLLINHTYSYPGWTVSWNSVYSTHVLVFLHINKNVILFLLFQYTPQSKYFLTPYTTDHMASLLLNYSDVIMSAMASQITDVSIVCTTVSSREDQRIHQSSASLTLLRGIHGWPVDSPHTGPVNRKIFSFNDVIMSYQGTTAQSDYAWK